MSVLWGSMETGPRSQKVREYDMGSLYDIGNMRYKHFTFYSRGDASEYTPLDKEYVSNPALSEADNAAAKAEHDVKFANLIGQLQSFLHKVWPRDAIFGYNAEDDTAFITYIKQDSTGVILVENIYIFRRSTVKVVGGYTGETEQQWMLTSSPTKSVNPADHINPTQQENQ